MRLILASLFCLWTIGAQVRIPGPGGWPVASTPTAATPTFSPVAGAITSGTTIAISTATGGCSSYIFWNFTGTSMASGTNSTTASGITTSSILYAQVVGCPGYANSAIASAAYTITGSGLPTLVSHGYKNATGSITTANGASLSTTGANFIVVVETLFQTATVAPTDTFSNTWHQCGTDQVNGNMHLGIWYAANATVGGTHAFGLSAATSYSSIYVGAFSGLSSSPCTTAVNGAAQPASGTVEPGSITPAANGSLIISSPIALDTSSTWVTTVNSGFTTTDTGSTPSVGTGGGLGYLAQSTAAAVNPTWSESGNQLVAAIQVAFK